MKQLTDLGVVRVRDVELTVGDYPKIVKLYEKASKEGVDIIVYNKYRFYTEDVEKLITSYKTI
jgi:hypothetical protein